MLIRDLRTEDGDGTTTFWATIDWEDRQTPPYEAYFALRESDRWRVSLNADAFRIPAAIVARRHGLERITGGGPMCPVLHDGLANSLAWLTRWNGPSTVIPRLEFEKGCTHPSPTPPGAAAGFVSGGVDSSALLVTNHLAHGTADPLRISVGIVVAGLQSHRWMDRQEIRDQLTAAQSDVAYIEAAMPIEIVPVATNIRGLDMDGRFWKYEYQGAALAGVANLFATTISNVSIASSREIAHIDGFGSHPLLDTGYGSHSMRIWHTLAHMGRLEKTALVASQPDLLKGLNVCNKAEAGDANCGRCDKCLRTKLALETMPDLRATPVFATEGLRPSDLKLVRIGDPGHESYYAEMLEPLRSAGRSDLARSVEGVIRKGRLLRNQFVRPIRVWGSKVFPRQTRERVLRIKKIPR